MKLKEIIKYIPFGIEVCWKNGDGNYEVFDESCKKENFIKEVVEYFGEFEIKMITPERDENGKEVISIEIWKK